MPQRLRIWQPFTDFQSIGCDGPHPGIAGMSSFNLQGSQVGVIRCWHSTLANPSLYSTFLSRRDRENESFLRRRGCVSKPRVARLGELPWVTRRNPTNSACGCCTPDESGVQHLAEQILYGPIPRVRSEASRPWALIHNPFGVKILLSRLLAFPTANCRVEREVSLNPSDSTRRFFVSS
jgi:hypothetical protein